METWDAITSRRNVRSFEDRPIAQEDLDRILEAGRRAPSSRNWQPWDFVVVTDRDQLAQLAKVWEYGQHVAAADLGIGSGHSAVADQDQARRVLGLPEDRYVAYLMDLGYPADRPLRPIQRPKRRPFDEVVHRGRW